MFLSIWILPISLKSMARNVYSSNISLNMCNSECTLEFDCYSKIAIVIDDNVEYKNEEIKYKLNFDGIIRRVIYYVKR